jgi:predicted DNA-binding protein (MmcQ/YjbR family)
MDVESLRNYCLSLFETSESFPFGEETLVFKVYDKIFALVNLDSDLSINLKCDPEMALELRERYPCVVPGYHMNKTHWNTVYIDGSVPDKLLKEWIDHSYWQIVAKLPKKLRLIIENQYYHE